MSIGDIALRENVHSYRIKRVTFPRAPSMSLSSELLALRKLTMIAPLLRHSVLLLTGLLLAAITQVARGQSTLPQGNPSTHDKQRSPSGLDESYFVDVLYPVLLQSQCHDCHNRRLMRVHKNLSAVATLRH